MDPSGKMPRQPPSEETKARAQAIIDAALSAAKIEIPHADKEADTLESGGHVTLAVVFTRLSPCSFLGLGLSPLLYFLYFMFVQA